MFVLGLIFDYRGVPLALGGERRGAGQRSSECGGKTRYLPVSCRACFACFGRRWPVCSWASGGAQVEVGWDGFRRRNWNKSGYWDWSCSNRRRDGGTDIVMGLLMGVDGVDGWSGG